MLISGAAGSGTEGNSGSCATEGNSGSCAVGPQGQASLAELGLLRTPSGDLFRVTASLRKAKGAAGAAAMALSGLKAPAQWGKVRGTCGPSTSQRTDTGHFQR